MAGDRDPGYGSTSRMLGEAAVHLPSRPRDALPGGFRMPATAMGDALIEALTEHAGSGSRSWRRGGGGGRRAYRIG